MSLRLLITGYPGWLTSRFLETLKEYPNVFSMIRCLVHSQHVISGLPQGPWEYVSGDLNDPMSLARALEGQDVVLHAAGIIHVQKIGDFYRINRDGTRNLLEAAVRAGVSKLVYISSNAAQGFCGGKGHELDESAPCRPVSHYGKSKRQGEEAVEEFQREGRIRTVILRPAMFYGPPVPSRHLDIYRRIQKGRFPVFGTGDYLRSVTYIDNLVQAVHLALTRKGADGKTFTIVDRETPTLNQIIRAMSKALGVSVKIDRYPRWIAQAAEIFDRVLEALGIYWMLPHIIGEAHKHIGYRIDWAVRELGYDPKVNYREGYRRAIDWCFASGRLDRSACGNKRKAVFFDRDGVLVRGLLREGEMATPLSLEEFEIEPEAAVLARSLRKRGFLIFVVTNQPDIARRRLNPAVLERMHERLCEALGGEDILSEVYVCPHDNEDVCDCRKPRPGMLLRAAEKWNVDLRRSFIIGDHARDVGAGRAAGCRTILIRKSYNQNTEADEMVDDLGEAVRRVFVSSESRAGQF